MQNIICTPEILATETENQRNARHAEFYARCAPAYAAFNRGERTPQAMAAKRAVMQATKNMKTA